MNSVLLSLIMSSFCVPIESGRTSLYQFYPEQANLCYRIGGAVLGDSDLDKRIREIEKAVEEETVDTVTAIVPPYLYGPVAVGGDIVLKKKVVVPVFKNETYIWFGQNSGGIVVNFVF